MTSPSAEELGGEYNEEPAKTRAESSEKKEKKEKKTRYVPLDLGSVPAQSRWTGFVPVAVSSPPSTVPVSAPKQPNARVGVCTAALESWSPVAHGGRRATDLTLAEAQEVVAFATTTYSRAGKVFVIKGAGSGEYATRVQLKVVHKTQTVQSSGKKATFHITLSPSVFDQLNLTESDE